MAMPDSTPANPIDQQSDHPTFAIHRNSDNPFGPHQIEVLKSDANSTRWPVVGPVMDSKGATCQWALSPIKSKSRWLSSLGKSLANILGLTKNSQKEDWRLKDFPNDYQIYTYTKGTREDQYLYGSTHVNKFRTANEFLPHLQWLVSNKTMDCLCKYCSGAKNQFEVNVAIGLPNLAPKSRPDGNQSADRTKRPKRSRSPTTINQVNSSYKFQGPYLSEELNRDLWENRSNFRKHELVWCLVTDLKVGASPELSRNSQDIGIKYWPGLCDDMTLCNETRAFISIPDDEKDLRGDSSESRNPLKRKLELFQASSQPASNELQHQQRFQWSIRLLGLSDIVVREEKQILPWLFKTADLKQKFGMNKKQAFRLPPHVRNKHSTMRPTLASFANADETLIAFQLAIQIAGNLEEFWSAHDRYDALTDPEANEKPGSAHRAASQDRVVTDLPTTWFQGIWWGAEQIWVYDLVRLNEFKLGPDLSLKAKAPAANSENTTTPTRKPGEDCYFLKLEGIYRDEKGMKLIIMGKIFDLVPNPKSPTTPPLSSPSLNTEKRRCNKSKKWMPDPPAGFKFRQLTRSKDMNYFTIECIAGRYYSPTRKNSSDKFSEICRRLAANLSQECEKNSNHSTLVAPNASLFGLTPGQKNFMRCRTWRPSRADSMFDAEALAEQDLISLYEKMKSNKLSRSVSHADENNFTQNTQPSSNTNQHKSNSNERSHKSKQQDQDRIVIIELDS